MSDTKKHEIAAKTKSSAHIPTLSIWATLTLAFLQFTGAVDLTVWQALSPVWGALLLGAILLVAVVVVSVLSAVVQALTRETSDG